MKKILISFLVTAIFTISFTSLHAQEVDKDILNWYNGKKPGMSTDAAYKLLKKKTPEKVIVAIIDSGIDIEHEDLQGKIWTNTKEVAGNGKDDDGNGYVDDVHGWNFLGNTKGENQEHARLNVTRIVAQLRPRFEGVEGSEVSAADKSDYELYERAVKYMEKNKAKYEGYITQLEQFRDGFLPTVPDMIAGKMGVDSYDEASLKKWKPKDSEGKRLKDLGLQILSGDLSEESINEQMEQIKGMVEHHYNPDYDDRSLIGDDFMNMDDLGYGNNDVEGPDALHGTHVGGIVASTRGNGLGGDGVADNVLLMSLRAVPDGDEFDKDIALAIRYAVDNGAKVINGSFGKAFSSLPRAVHDAILYAQENDVLFVHAAGNDAKDLAKEDNFPAVKYEFQTEPFTHLLTIGASTRVAKEELAARFSNYGADQVDIFAPGFEIYNTVPDNKYKKLQGTSMAAPMVSGVAAMLKGYFPELSMYEIKEIILESGDDYSQTDQKLPGSMKLVKFGTLSRTGKVVNAKSAVKLAQQRVKEKGAAK